MKSHPRTILISGTGRNSGKTTLACWMLPELPGWAAVKVSVCHHDWNGSPGQAEASPAAEPESCHICSDLEGPYELLAEYPPAESTSETAGKDSGRFLEAGASRAYWLRARGPAELRGGFRELLGIVADQRGLLVEGAAAYNLIDPDLSLFVGHMNKGTWKLKSRDRLHNSDVLIDVAGTPLKSWSLRPRPEDYPGLCVEAGDSGDSEGAESFLDFLRAELNFDF